MKASLGRLTCLSLFACILLSGSAAYGQGRGWPSEGPPRPLAARDVTFPPYEIRNLPNGLQVVVVMHHEQPAVSVRLLVRAGAAYDPPGKGGLATLAASLLDQGTTSRSAQEIADTIDSIGGGLGTGAGSDLSFINVVVMKDSFNLGLDLLSDVARHPAFAGEEIERQRQQALSSMKVSYEDPDYIAGSVFDRLVYGFHPYGVPNTGTPESLVGLTREDVLQYHSRYFAPNNSILAIVGDVTAAEAFASAERVLGDWSRRDIQLPKFPDPPEPTRRVVVINKPGAVQTEVRAGHLGIKRSHQDYQALNMTLRILGGEGANRLHQVLRTERGLTYGAKADLNTLLESGDFEASTNTRSEATGEVLRLIVDEFWRIKRERVGERELSDAKAYLTGSFPLTIETPDAIATQVLNVLFYGLPVEQLQSFRDRVNAVRTDDIERVARYYLQPDRLSIVLVGNASAFVPQLKGLGFGNVEVVEMDDLDLMAADLRRPGSQAPRAVAPAAPGRRGTPGAAVRVPLGATVAYQPTAAQGAIRPPQRTEDGASARALLDRVIAAKGGLERLRAVKSLVVTTRARALGPNAPPDPADTVTYIEYPNHVRVESRIRGTDVIQVFDGSRGWVRDPNGTHDVPERMLRDFQNGLRRDTIAVLLAAADGTIRVRRLPDARDDAGVPQAALEFSASDLDPMVMYIDASTGLVSRQTYVAGGMGQPLVEERFSDYREADGVQITFAASVRVGGQPALERTVTEVKVGGPLDPALFKRPAP